MRPFGLHLLRGRVKADHAIPCPVDIMRENRGSSHVLLKEQGTQRLGSRQGNAIAERVGSVLVTHPQALEDMARHCAPERWMMCP